MEMLFFVCEAIMLYKIPLAVNNIERRLGFVEADALLIILGYLLGMWFLYSRGIGV